MYPHKFKWPQFKIASLCSCDCVALCRQNFLAPKWPNPGSATDVLPFNSPSGIQINMFIGDDTQVRCNFNRNNYFRQQFRKPQKIRRWSLQNPNLVGIFQNKNAD